jgi:hypothetical protein
MRMYLATFCLAAIIAAPVGAQEPSPAPDIEAVLAAPAPVEKEPVQLGNGIVLPREVFDELMSHPDGLEMLDRWQSRANESQNFQGVPHLVLIFAAVLVFFGLSMVYYQLKNSRLHRTIKLMIEKGLPLPAEILRAIEQSEAGSDNTSAAANAAAAPLWASNLLWGGLLWITVGATGSLYLWARGSEAWPWGIAGIVYGLGAVLTAMKKRAAANP